MCERAYNSRESCKREVPALAGNAGCIQAESAILGAVLNPPPCANPVEIAAKLKMDAPFISVEQIERTLNNEDTELAFNMGLAVTDPVSQKTYHLIRDGFHPVIIGKRDHVEVRGLTGDLDDFDVVLDEQAVLIVDTGPARPSRSATNAEVVCGVWTRGLWNSAGSRPLPLLAR